MGCASELELPRFASQLALRQERERKSKAKCACDLLTPAQYRLRYEGERSNVKVGAGANRGDMDRSMRHSVPPMVPVAVAPWRRYRFGGSRHAPPLGRWRLDPEPLRGNGVLWWSLLGGTRWPVCTVGGA